ncbi:MAG: integral rane sensor signal transduction histidine kinase [Paenibacillus sp.]|jgi:two-component system sensor histidine kinase YesM|uniref:cache domain-containing sensor histidine kinase n=1 Tax=Paenibacillus sp. GCM10012303 TaxID=3317340 RepID=UPI0029ED6F61|nr:integral rane sensor signal transduction histidine kinase [Paenibacillus sp.]
MMKKRLSRQLFVYFLVVIVMSLTTVGIFSYTQSSRALDRQSERYISQIITSAAYQTDIYLRTYERASQSLLTSMDLKRFLDINPNDSYEYYQYYNALQKELFPTVFILHPQTHLIYLIGEHGRAVADDNSTQLYTPNFRPAEQYAMLLERTPENGAIAMFKSSIKPDQADRIITMARRVRGVSSYTPNGVLAIEFKEQDLAQMWKPLDIGERGFFFIVDEQGGLIYRPADSEYAGISSGSLLHKVTETGNGSFLEKLNGENRLFVTRKSDYSNWTIAISVPVQELRGPVSAIRSTTLVVGLLTLVAAIFAALRFGRSIVKPIQVLKNGMRQTEKGNWAHIHVPERQDEIGSLIVTYNRMVTRLSELVEEVYAAELKQQGTLLDLQETRLERHRAEFQALQMQINPHFLYNTLETIKCYAVVQDSAEITEMVEAMAFMLRYSIQTNLEEITMANELKHVLSYMTVLRHRHGRDFDIDVAVPPELLLEKMVRLTLQPIVENIFQHAFPDGIEDRHYIRIDARREDDRFLVIVEDNGAGMSPEKLEALREKLKQNRLAEPDTGSIYHRGGIGLMNVHRRIQLVFGEQYGMSVGSERGKGTRITLTMPGIRNKLSIAAD